MSNEITARLELLTRLDISGTVIMINTMRGQKKIAEQNCSAKGDYVLTLKENHRRTNFETSFPPKPPCKRLMKIMGELKYHLSV